MRTNQEKIKHNLSWKKFYKNHKEIISIKSKIIRHKNKNNHIEYFKNNILLCLLRKEFKKERISDNEHRKIWYLKNKEVYNLLRRWEYRYKKWLPCLQMNLENKTIYFPFEWLEKENKKIFNLILDYYK